VRVVAVVQARSGSSRLPGKVLMPVAGAPLLARMVERVRAASARDDVVVATTTLPEDQVIVRLCREIGVPVYTGHATDLVDRHLQAARAAGAEAVAKIPSDCPLIDPRVIDRVVLRFREGASDGRARFDYVSNLHPASYPDGNDVEVLPLSVLEQVDREARRPHEREHTTPFVWDQPNRFRLDNVSWDSGLDYSMSHRFTIDYLDDYRFVASVYQRLYRPGAIFSLRDILDLLAREPDIFQLNRHLAGVNWYRHHLGELRTVTSADTALGDPVADMEER
jgi:spore coat polysaccharide biosynthesis protein SpsF